MALAKAQSVFWRKVRATVLNYTFYLFFLYLYEAIE